MVKPFIKHFLYTAIRADGTAPLDVPVPKPSRLALLTKFPAAIGAASLMAMGVSWRLGITYVKSFSTVIKCPNNFTVQISYKLGSR